jgi:hypothetical protein
MTTETTDDISTRRFNFQKELVEKGFEQVQKQVMHLDDILFRIKASAITVWVALMGWAFTSDNPLIVPLGVVVIIGFWLLEAMFKGAQIGYIRTSLRLMQVVNDTGSLQKQFEEQEFEGGIVYPLALKPTEKERLVLMGKGFISPTVATVYLFLAFANALIWLALG